MSHIMPSIPMLSAIGGVPIDARGGDPEVAP